MTGPPAPLEGPPADAVPEEGPEVRGSVGDLLVALGFGLVVLSIALAWANQPPPFQQGVYTSSIPLPNLISESAGGRQPTVALTLLALALPGLGLAMLGWVETWVVMTRRVLALLAFGVVVLFVIRWRSFFGPDLGVVLRSFRAGFYLAAAGSVLAFVSGRWRAARPVG